MTKSKIFDVASSLARCLLLVYAVPCAAEFVRVPLSYSPLAGFSLYEVDSHPELNIKYQVEQAEQSVIGDSPAKYYRIRFGRLTEEQFRFLRSTYAFAGTAVPFDSNRQYDLLDFLPPLIQATDGWRMGIRLIEQPSGRFHQIRCNCWSTVYEINRNAPAFAIFQADSGPMLSLLRDDRFSQPVAESASDAIFTDGTIKPGDTVLFFARKALDHTVTYIDRGLVYEQPSSHGDFPFRLSFTHDAQGRLQHNPINYFMTSQRVEVRRFFGTGLPPLPHPAVAFSLPQPSPRYRDRDNVSRDIPYVVASGLQLGRAMLPPVATVSLSTPLLLPKDMPLTACEWLLEQMADVP